MGQPCTYTEHHGLHYGKPDVDYTEMPIFFKRSEEDFYRTGVTVSEKRRLIFPLAEAPSVSVKVFLLYSADISENMRVYTNRPYIFVFEACTP